MAAREELSGRYGRQQPAACRFSLGYMAPAQAARGSFRQGPIETESMMIKHEIQAAAHEEPHW